MLYTKEEACLDGIDAGSGELFMMGMESLLLAA